MAFSGVIKFQVKGNNFWGIEDWQQINIQKKPTE